MNTPDSTPRSRAAALVAALIATILLACAASPGMAMEFSTLTLPEGQRIVLAQGPVTEGDANRLRIALQAADRDASGHKVLALDSPGGLVIEAFAMVDVMDRERVATVVRSDASCASACAQILFLSGRHRTLEGSGRIGLHACHTASDRRRAMACNELIAQNALARGTPYDAIMAFMHLTPPTQMRWLAAAEADCWGFTKPPAVKSGATPVAARTCF